MATKKLRALTIMLMVLIALMALGSYSSQVAPAFEKPTVADNSAVRELVASKDYQGTMSQVFAEVRDYNRWSRGIKPDPCDYIAISVGPFVTVTAVVHALDNAKRGGGEESNSPAFRFETEYSVSLTIAGLVLFLIFEVFLLAGIVYARWIYTSRYQLGYEDRIIAEYYQLPGDSRLTSVTAEAQCLFVLEKILLGFHRFCLQLERRKRNREGLKVVGEYDVQDLLLPLLRLTFSDVRSEESVPSEAGSNSRIDFLIQDHGIAIEVKYVRRSGDDARIGDEMLADRARYFSHPNCKQLVFFVYDPNTLLDNAQGMISGVANDGPNQPVRVVVSPVR
jgi:hypothetical protein